VRQTMAAAAPASFIKGLIFKSLGNIQAAVRVRPNVQVINFSRLPVPEGFARMRCPDCKEKFFVAFSCCQRFCCPSCDQKRALLLAYRLQGEVLADVPHRQWVLPYRSGWGCISGMIESCSASSAGRCTIQSAAPHRVCGPLPVFIGQNGIADKGRQDSLPWVFIEEAAATEQILRHCKLWKEAHRPPLTVSMGPSVKDGPILNYTLLSLPFFKRKVSGVKRRSIVPLSKRTVYEYFWRCTEPGRSACTEHVEVSNERLSHYYP